MKYQKSTGYTIACISGVILIIAGILLAIFYTVPYGVMPALPFALGGVGLGAFGGGLSGVISVCIMKKDPGLAKQVEIEENDERNITIENKAKAKTDTLISMLLWALIIFLAVMQVQLFIILVFVGVAFLRMFVLFYLLNRYRKEM